MIRIVPFLWILFLLSGCNFEYQLTGEVQDIDPTLVGKWRSLDGEETIEVRAAGDGYRMQSLAGENSAYLFDKAVILKIKGFNFLQAHFLGLKHPNGTITLNTKRSDTYLVRVIERKGDTVILRTPNFRGRKLNKFNSAQEYRAAFAAAIHQDGFFGAPTTYRKVGSQKAAPRDKPGGNSVTRNNIKAIIKNMAGNRFVVSDAGKNQDRIGIIIGTYLFKFNHLHNKTELCFLTFENSSDKGISKEFFDNGCDGSLDIIRKKKGVQSFDITAADQSEYSRQTRVLANLAQVARQYKSYNPKPRLSLFPDIKTFQENNRLIADILRYAERSRMTQFGDGKIVVSIAGLNDRRLVLVALYNDNKYYKSCTIMETDKTSKIIWVDDNCNGTVDSFKKGNSKWRRADQVGNIKVVNSLLLDLKRFVKFAQENFPKY